MIQILKNNTPKQLIKDMLDNTYQYNDIVDKKYDYDLHLFIKTNRSRGSQDDEMFYNNLVKYLSPYCILNSDDMKFTSLKNSVTELIAMYHDRYKEEYKGSYLFSFKLNENLIFTENQLNRIYCEINEIGEEYYPIYNSTYKILALYIVNDKVEETTKIINNITDMETNNNVNITNTSINNNATINGGIGNKIENIANATKPEQKKENFFGKIITWLVTLFKKQL